MSLEYILYMHYLAVTYIDGELDSLELKLIPLIYTALSFEGNSIEVAVCKFHPFCQEFKELPVIFHQLQMAPAKSWFCWRNVNEVWNMEPNN